MGSTYKTKLKKIFTYQKKAARVIFFGDHRAHATPLMFDMNALNVYQLNIYQNLILLYKAHTSTALLIFFTKFSKAGLRITVGHRTMSDQNQKLSDQTKNTPDILSDGKNSR